ncbi:MAG: hypothetical protein EHM58_02295 [Ignavibacteriae bacterium]|nr:MAG: hypothetical protein EHM58_02295 [Ignavibacteriota bacterium]
MDIINTFPVFEPNQVLSDRHLNTLINYLEQQDRLTKNKIIGMGIVCGLEITAGNDVIKISKGCGITSQGFIMTFCNTEFRHYMPYNSRSFPEHLNLICTCRDNDNTAVPFYKEKVNDSYNDIYKGKIFQLITSEEFDNLNTDEKKSASIISELNLDKYAVVLFLETEEVNLKNCDNNDCNDKGSRMDFDVKALLVKKTILNSLKKQYEKPLPDIKSSVSPSLHHIELQRYNVPDQDLKSADDVLQAFAGLVDDAKLKGIAEVLNYCYVNYYYLLKDEPNNPFSQVFEQFKSLRDKIISSQPVLIQYFYDFIDDILNAYYEFKNKVFHVTSWCCSDEMRFPLHLMLGEASVNTNPFIKSKYREYFIYTPLYNNQEEKLEEVRLLFTRIRLLIQEVSFDSIADFEKKFVKITPSRNGYTYLSDRCIPYYYNTVDPGNELYRYWNYDKIKRGNERFNLSYYSSIYCTAPNIVSPLLYDLERFNFFRIEGHIGKYISTALNVVKSLQLQFNLPFETAALSADYIGALVKGEEPKCVIEDLESDYRTLITEFICKIHDAYSFVANIKYEPQISYVFNPPVLNSDTSTAKSESDPSAAKENIDIFIFHSMNNALNFKVNKPYISSMVNEYQALKNYQKGNTFERLFRQTQETTIGKYYSENLKEVFENPVNLSNISNDRLKLYHYFFDFIDNVEDLIKELTEHELAEINITLIKSMYAKLSETINFNHRLINDFYIPLIMSKTSVQPLNEEEQGLLNIFVKNIQLLNQSCFIERLESLKNEYIRRTAQYRLAKNFINYFRKHPGLEHKAGVPKGGTFILVYHEERRNRLIDPGTLYINKELGNLLLTNFHALLKPEVKPDEMEFNTRLTQIATLYKDPDIYLKLKDAMNNMMDDCKELPEEKKKKIIDIIEKPPRESRFELTDGMVIADFYIPYVCCSDCQPVAYILQETHKEEAIKPTLEIDKETICSDSKIGIKLQTDPKEGGSFLVDDNSAKDENIRYENENFYFIPGNLIPGTHKIAFKNNSGISDTKTITIVPKPKANFAYKVEKTDNEKVEISLINNSTDTIESASYEWYFKNKIFSRSIAPENFKFKANETGNVIQLVVKNRECEDKYEEEIKFKLPVEKLTIMKCINQEIFVLEPDNLKPVNILKSEAEIIDTIKVKIDLVKTYKKEQYSYLINYTLPSVKEKEVTLIILSPNADFNIEIKEITDIRNTTTREGSWQNSYLMLSAKNKYATGFNWNIIQGKIKLTFYTKDIEVDFVKNKLTPPSGKMPINVELEIINDIDEKCNSAVKYTISDKIYKNKKNTGMTFDNHFIA